VTDSVVKTFDLQGGGNNYGRLALNPDLGRVYYTDRASARIYTIDVLADSVLSQASLPSRVDSMFLDRRLQKLYLCNSIKTLVFDCAQGAIVDSINARFDHSGLMDDRNDKLYLNYGAVVDCRYDSVVTQLDSIDPRSIAWDAIDNRVFQATTSRLYVYRDDPYGVEEEPTVPLKRRHATIVRGVLFLPRDMTETAAVSDRVPRPILLDVSGRKVMDLNTGANDVRTLAPGVYFIRTAQAQAQAIRKIVIAR
jgi:hypothetical protein